MRYTTSVDELSTTLQRGGGMVVGLVNASWVQMWRTIDLSVVEIREGREALSGLEGCVGCRELYGSINQTPAMMFTKR